MNALETLRETLDAAEFETRRIQAATSQLEPGDFDQITWSHVGDANRLLSQLREITGWLCPEEE